MKTLQLVIAGSIALASGVSIANARTDAARSIAPHHYYGVARSQERAPAPFLSDQGADQSGSLGREGLGANPGAPEGPGNFAE